MSQQARLGDTLRRLRTSAGLTQEELAEGAGISVRTISDVERGLRTTVYRDTAQRIASALNLDDGQRSAFEQLARGGSRRGPRRTSTLEPGRSQVPLAPTRLIGRERELEVVNGAIADPAIRLLTLTGPGGIGKTRIAMEAASRAETEFDRVVFIPLSGLNDFELIPSTVAAAVGATSANEPLSEAVADHIAGSRWLIVFDTFEHLLDGAPFVSDLLSRAKDLKVLATSREILHLLGEHEVVIPTLELPGEEWKSPLAEARLNPATTLFIERAQAARSDFRLNDDTALIIREICERLNGLPLAIELAAARMRHLPLPTLSSQLEDRLSILTGGPRDLPRRQQTMRDTIAWSFELLGDEEQSLLKGLSVFAGGWTLESATAVCFDDGSDRQSLRLLSSLMDKSLISLPAPARGPDERFAMLDVVREFAHEEAASGDAFDRLRQTHAEFFLSLAEAAEPQLGGRDQREWFMRLETEHDNLRVALHRFIETQNSEGALRLSGALWFFWRGQGHFSEGRMWLRSAIALVASESAPALAKALWGASWLAFNQGDHQEAQRLSDDLIRVAKQNGNRLDQRNALTVRGMILMSQGRPDEAVKQFETALELCADVGPSWVLGTSHLNLGTAMLHARDLQGAERLIGRARDIYREIGDEHFGARSVAYLGFAALLAGDFGRARSMFANSLKDFAELEDRQGIAEGLEGLAAVAAAEKTIESAAEAARLSGAAEAIRDKLVVKQYPHDKASMDPFIEQAKQLLGDQEWVRTLSEGKETDLEEVILSAMGTG